MRRALAVLALALGACSGADPDPTPSGEGRIIAFTATPATLRAGESTTLAWETEGGDGVAIEPTVGLQPPTGSIKVRPIARTIYTLRLRTGTEVLTAQVTVEVDGGAPQIERFSAEPRTIQPGESTTLSWATVNATRVTIAPDAGDQPAVGTLTVSPMVTTTYVLTASSDVGSVSREVTVVVASGNQPFIRTFEASAQAVSAGDAVTLRWDVANATSVTINPDLGSGPPSGSAEVRPARTTVYTLSAVGPGGMASASLTIAVNAGGDPRVLVFELSPTTIAPGGSATLSWETDNATGVLIEPGIGPQAAKDSRVVSPSATTTYRLTALGNAGAEARAEVTLTVAGVDTPVVLELSASPMAVVAGGSTTLSWRTMNATAVDIAPGVGAGLMPSGSIQVSPAATTTYTLTARGSGGTTATATLEITVAAPPPVITQFAAQPASVNAGQPVTLAWSTTDATTVMIDQGIGAVPASGTRMVTPAATTTYQLSAAGPGGMVTGQVTVTVTPVGAPTIGSFAASPAQITPGATTQLSWTTSGATSVRIDNGVGTVALSGMTSVSPPSTTTYTLTAEGPGGTTTAPVTVQVSSPNGDQCSTAFDITASGTYTGNTLTAVDDYREVSACTGFEAAGADQVYRVSLVAGDRLRASLLPGAPSWDASLYLLTSCAQIAASCVAGSDRGNPETIDYVAPSAGTYYLVVDGFRGAGGSYGLEIELNPAPVPNDRCMGAVSLGRGGTFTGSTRSATNDYDPGTGGCTRYAEASNDVTYQVSLAAGERLQASLTATWDAALYVVRDCANVAGTCAAGSDAGNPETIDLTAATAGTYFVVVDGYGRASGDFSLTVTISPPVLGGETCANAIVVPASGASFMSTTVGFTNDYSPPVACTGFPQAGPDRVYRADLARGDVLEALVDFAPGLDGSMYVVTDCAQLASSCVDGSDYGLAGEAEAIRYVARTAGPHYVVVDAELSASAGAHELFALSYTGETCAAAAPLRTDAVPEWYTTTGRSNDYSPNAGGCTSFSASGEDRVYSVGLRAGDQLRVTSAPDTGYDTSLYLVSNCADVNGSCVAGSDRTGNVVERISPVVQSSGTYYLVVDGFGGSDGTGTLTATISHGDTCRDAYRVPTGGGTFRGTTTGYAADYGIGSRTGSCTGWQQSGADAVYRVDLGAGQRLTAQLTSTWDGSLYLISDCAASATTCVAGSDDGNPEDVTFTNGATARTYYLVVDSYSAGASYSGNYTLTIAVQ